jgi:hypothetical protein
MDPDSPASCLLAGQFFRDPETQAGRDAIAVFVVADNKDDEEREKKQ